MKSQLSASLTSPIANEDNIKFKSLFRRRSFLKFVFSVFIIDFFSLFKCDRRGNSLVCERQSKNK